MNIASKLRQPVGAFLIGVSLIAGGASAQGSGSRSSELLNSNLIIDIAETKSVRLGRYSKVESIIVQAEGISQDATVEVFVNGEVKGTLYLPARDPSYVVTVGEVTNSIEFRHVAGGRARIRSVFAYMANSSYEDRWNNGEFDSPSMGLPVRNEAAALAKRAIVLVDVLEKHANYANYGQYLLPVKKAAARAYAKSSARGSLSGQVRESLFALLGELELSLPYIEDAFERDAAFEAAVELLSLREKLERCLN